MELLGEDAISSIADLCGLSLNKSRKDEEEEEEEQTADITPSQDCDKTKYIIRRGKEEDVLRDVGKR